MKEPRSFFKEPRPDLWVAVGIADRSPSAAMSAQWARADAMNKLAQAIETGVEGSAKQGEVFSRQQTDVIVVGAEERASWVSAKGTTYVLLTASKEKNKQR
ncbi:MAG: hypothetical protein AB1486_08335 [Planctomycetota bacterium]